MAQSTWSYWRVLFASTISHQPIPLSTLTSSGEMLTVQFTWLGLEEWRFTLVCLSQFGKFQVFVKGSMLCMSLFCILSHENLINFVLFRVCCCYKYYNFKSIIITTLNSTYILSVHTVFQSHESKVEHPCLGILDLTV